MKAIKSSSLTGTSEQVNTLSIEMFKAFSFCGVFTFDQFRCLVFVQELCEYFRLFPRNDINVIELFHFCGTRNRTAWYQTEFRCLAYFFRRFKYRNGAIYSNESDNEGFQLCPILSRRQLQQECYQLSVSVGFNLKTYFAFQSVL